jgi:hypothetical protein
MPRRTRFSVEVWFEVTHYTFVAENHTFRPTEKRIGLYGTKKEAEKHGKPYGVLMDEKAQRHFRTRANPDVNPGGYGIRERLVQTSGVVEEGVGWLLTITSEKVKMG